MAWTADHFADILLILQLNWDPSPGAKSPKSELSAQLKKIKNCSGRLPFVFYFLFIHGLKKERELVQ
uniref:Uncharacterized protein n=1 Tax=Caenorhabditis japonica TaxID=281687 RepID=A0A8R1EQ68_CAEJA